MKAREDALVGSIFLTSEGWQLNKCEESVRKTCCFKGRAITKQTESLEAADFLSVVLQT